MQTPNADHLINEKHRMASLKAGVNAPLAQNASPTMDSLVSRQLSHSVKGSLMYWSTTELRKFLLEIKLHMCSRECFRNLGELDEHVPFMSEVQITLAERWNKSDEDVNFVNLLLSTYTNLQSLNGLQEWPEPPLAHSSTWDLTDKLHNPLYECNFVKNRLRLSVSITSLIIDKNDMRGRAAQEIAHGISVCRGLSSLSAQDCKWDDSIFELAAAVRQRTELTIVNGNSLRDDDTEWILRGRVVNAIDACFVVRMLTEKGPLGNLWSIDLRGNTLLRDNAVIIAEALNAVHNLSEINAISLPLPSELSPRNEGLFEEAKFHLERDPRAESKDDVGLQSPLSHLSGVSSPHSPDREIIAEALDMRKRLLSGRFENDVPTATSGTLPIELT